MKIILSLCLVLLLQGCPLFAKKENLPIPSAKTANIDTELLTPCESLNEMVIITTFEDPVAAYADLATKYGSCATKQNKSIKIIKQLGNIK